MKTILSILLIFICHVSIGQDEPRLTKYIESFAPDKVTFRTQAITDYQYSSSGKLIEAIKKNYDNGIFSNVTGVFYEYDANDLLVKESSKSYNADTDLWITIDYKDYLYDINGCLIGENNIENIEGKETQIRYEKDADCRITKKSFWKRQTSNDSLNLEYEIDRIYSIDTITYREIKYKSGSIQSKKDFIEHSDGRLDKVYTRSLGVIDTIRFKRKYTYDQYNNFSQWEDFYKAPINSSVVPEGWVWIGTDFSKAIKTYDAEGQIIEMKTGQYDYFFDYYSDYNTYNYEYECGEEKVVYMMPDDPPFYRFRYESFYEGNPDCFYDEKEEPTIHVFPNPTTGKITVSSNIFNTETTEDTRIRIFDISGKLLLEENEIERKRFFDYDLSGLANGIYIIQLLNQKSFAKAKLVIAK